MEIAVPPHVLHRACIDAAWFPADQWGALATTLTIQVNQGTGWTIRLEWIEPRWPFCALDQSKLALWLLWAVIVDYACILSSILGRMRLPSMACDKDLKAGHYYSCCQLLRLAYSANLCK